MLTFITIHFLLVLSSLVLALVSKETSWWVWVALSLIPILGPFVSIIGYLWHLFGPNTPNSPTGSL